MPRFIDEKELYEMFPDNNVHTALEKETTKDGAYRIYFIWMKSMFEGKVLKQRSEIVAYFCKKCSRIILSDMQFSENEEGANFSCVVCGHILFWTNLNSRKMKVIIEEQTGVTKVPKSELN